MNKYKVMLVDDEKDVMDIIRRKIDWNAIGLEEPFYAENGLEALETAESRRPDIVLTDIKMPYMDGLELSRQLKQIYPNIRIIILSGFDEFEYAKEAVRLNAEEYILKPIDAERLTKVFERVKKSLDKETSERQNKMMLENYYRDSLPVLRENFFASLVQGRIVPEDIPEYLQNYQIEIGGPLYAIVLFHTSSAHIPDGMNYMLLSMSVRKLAEEKFPERWEPHTFNYLNNLCMLVSMKDTSELQELTDEADRFCRLAKSVLDAIVTCGIGSVCNSLSEIPASYNGARQAVSYRVIYGSGRSINISEVEPNETEVNSDLSETELRELFKRIRLEDTDRIKEAVDTYLKDNMPHSSLTAYELFVTDLVGQLGRFARSNHLDINEVFQTDGLLRQDLNSDPDGLHEWLEKICLEMQKKIQEMRKANTRDFVRKAQDYVQIHYDDPDLTQASLCKVLGVSTSYFSTVFKKETKQSFTSYLTDIRMSKAATLLLEENEKSYIIARRVGYNDPNYFSYVFRRRFGVSPSRYKQEK